MVQLHHFKPHGGAVTPPVVYFTPLVIVYTMHDVIYTTSLFNEVEPGMKHDSITVYSR
jgi:hypothetical protein